MKKKRIRKESGGEGSRHGVWGRFALRKGQRQERRRAEEGYGAGLDGNNDECV